MKSVILILILLLVNSVSAEVYYLNSSDTLDNKGDSNLDTLSLNNTDSLNQPDTLASSKNISTNLFIESIGFTSNNSYSNKIKQKDFSTDDYRNLSDVFTYMPFGFVQDLGSLGHPNEQMFYGLGFSNISYSRDGVLLNNRWQNSYDLNKLNSERIDSIEIVPLTRGFLYSPYNNPVGVNMHSRFNYAPRAVTQLKFFQASYDEGFVDVLFHTPITNKLNFGIGISNSAIDSRFENSDYESWKLDAKIAYLVNEKINITANYFYSYDTLALFGGLDTNSFQNDNIVSALYKYDITSRKSSRYQLTYNNNANVKLLTTLIPYSKTDVTFYYNSTSQKFMQNKDTLFNHLPVITNDNFFQTFGVRFQNLYKRENISVDIIANYETSTFDTDIFSSVSRQNIFTLSGEIKLPILNNKYFIPSVFSKTSRINDINMFGFGGDISGEINNNIFYYAGISWFQQQSPILEKDYHIGANYFPAKPSDNNSVEIGIGFNSDILFSKVSYFNFSSKNQSIPFISQSGTDSLVVNELSIYSGRSINNSGVNISFNLKLWKFIFSNNFNYYLNSREERVYASPDYTLAGKLYYLDKLFNNNLQIKVGINYRFTGEQTPFVYDFEKLLQMTRKLTPMVQYSNVPSSFQLDLYMAGTIQELATIFVTLENTLNAEYYIAPYYFKQPITLRLGVSWLMFD